MKRFISIISILGAGTIILTSSAIFLNGCAVKKQDEQSSSQAQTSQETLTLEEQLQIENEHFERLGIISNEAKERLRQAIDCRDQCKVALDYALKSGDLSLIQRAKKDVQDFEEVVNKIKETCQSLVDDTSQSFEKIILLTKQIKDSKGT